MLLATEPMNRGWMPADRCWPALVVSWLSLVGESARMMYELEVACASHCTYVSTAVQVTPTSSPWVQSSLPPRPLLSQLASLLSVPSQATLSSQVEPVPWPKWADW